MKHKSIVITSDGKMEEDVFWKGGSLRKALEIIMEYARKMEEATIKEQNEIHNGVDSKSDKTT